MRTFAVLLSLSCAASAQTVLRPAALETSLAAPAASIIAPAAASFSIAPALSLTPALAAAPAALPALAAPAPALLAPLSAPAASEDKPKAGTPKAAGELKKAAAEFQRLVADLMGGGEKSEAAALALTRLKEEHLNADPDPKRTRVLDLKPMQIPAGMLEVQDKARGLRDMKAKEIEAWLKDRSVPVLEDYRGRKRPVDHHHEARAAWEADSDEIYTHRYFDDELHGLVKALPRAEFYAVTRAMGLFYDRDQFGAGPHDPNHLPEDVRSMADDPFRSVAWKVRKQGGFDKSPVPFAEFQWANYFRERLKTYPTRADFDAAVAEAMGIVHAPAAKKLPGWKPK